MMREKNWRNLERPKTPIITTEVITNELKSYRMQLIVQQARREMENLKNPNDFTNLSSSEYLIKLRAMQQNKLVQNHDLSSLSLSMSELNPTSSLLSYKECFSAHDDNRNPLLIFSQQSKSILGSNSKPPPS